MPPSSVPMRRAFIPLLILAAAAACGGCGQKGPLTLPPAKPAVVAPAHAAPAPASAASAASSRAAAASSAT
ncbi:MAG TPA: lipoprotein [Rhodanobacteraceae bacterium]|nr:lipoprotein [Rhodanobacteraceae bacterium]